MPRRPLSHEAQQAKRRRKQHDKQRDDDDYRRFLHSADWDKLRLAQLAAHPLCALCEEQGRTTAATVVHHVKRGREGHARDTQALQSLCKPCHDEQTARESWGE